MRGGARPVKAGRGPLRLAAERGSILVETVFLLVLLTLPVFYLVATLARLQAGAYAVSAAAREAGRAFVTAVDDASGAERAHAAAGLVYDALGFSSQEGSVTLSCPAQPCLSPGSSVQVDSTVSVQLPLIPDFMDGIVPTTIVLTSSHLEPVDEFREP